MEWDFGNTLAPRPGDAASFKTLTEKYVHYTSPPLPLVTIATMKQLHKKKKLDAHLSAMSADLSGSHLLCVAGAGAVTIYRLMHSRDGITGASEEDPVEDSYEAWSSAHSSLSLVCLAKYQLPRNEAVVCLKTCLVKGNPLLCVATSLRLLIFQIPVTSKLPLSVTSDLLLHPVTSELLSAEVSCLSTDSERPVNTVSVRHIVTCCLSPYVAGEVAVVTELGEVSICNAGESKKREVEVKGASGCGSISFGSHSRHLLILSSGSLCSIDSRNIKLPVVWKDCRPLVGKEVYGELCCVALSPRQPFLLHLATPTHLIVTDIRQPLEPHLYEPHLLESLPCSLAIIVTCNFTMVLIGSIEKSVVLRYSTGSLPLCFLGPSHVICMPSDVLPCLERSELVGQLRGGVAKRLDVQREKLLGVGVSVLPLGEGLFAGLALSAVGDVFYQTFKYSTCTSGSTACHMSTKFFHAYKLWISEQAQKLRQVKGQLLVEQYPATVRDMTDIARVLVEGVSDQTSPQHDTRRCSLKHDQDTRRCALKHDQDTRRCGLKHDQDTRRCGLKHDQDTRRCGLKHDQDTRRCGLKHDQDTRRCGLKNDQDTWRCGVKGQDWRRGGTKLLQAKASDICATTPLDQMLLERWADHVPPLKLFDDTQSVTDTFHC